MNVSTDVKGRKEEVYYDTAGIYHAFHTILNRDKEQSHRLHEPESIYSHTDPITGHDVMGVEGHPVYNDNGLTIYFESEKTRDEYINTPFNHPVLRLPGVPTIYDDRGG